MTLGLRAAAVSDVGPYRDVNQDAAFTAWWGAAVADGVGGGPAGDLASATLLRGLTVGTGRRLDPDDLAGAVRLANGDLRDLVEYDRSLDGMATTVTGLFVCSTGGLLLAHAGDSRAYRLRGGLLTRETRDDSFVQLLVDSGMLPAADAASHPQRNLITASLRGSEWDVIALAELDGRAGDRWLLCSDGVSDYLDDDTIQIALGAGDMLVAAAEIVRLALASGSRDNVTAVVCDVVSAGDVAEHREPVFSGAAAGPVEDELDGPQSD